ncbi:MAG: sugar phosphate isomerase/epimerase family protein [Thermoguttaceae bacterium]
MPVRCSLLLCVLFALSAVSDRQAEAAPPPPKVYAYCMEIGVPGLKPHPLAEQAKILCELGFDGAGIPILVGDQLDETLRVLDQAGLKIYLLQTSINVNPKAAAPFDARVPDAIRKLKGRPVVVVVTLDGLKPGDPAGMEPAVKALRTLGDVAAEAGVRISVYNHVGCWAESVPFNVELVKKVHHPQVGFNFNVCHWLKVTGDKDYEPLLRENADKLVCVTICGAQIGANTWTNGLIQPLDQGNFDNRKLLATLHEIGYQGPVGLMCYGIPGDLREILLKSMKTWKAWTAQP